MREYKFRAWDKQNKKMFPVDWISFQKTAVGFIWDYGNMVRPKREKVKGFDEIKLMQYTGLKDKNGKEIYEGDIVKDALGMGVVGYAPPSFCVQSKPSGEYYALAKGLGMPDNTGLEFTEAIGNIYENPELLKEGK